MEIHEPFNPLHKKNLGLSVAEAMLQKEVTALPPAPFIGAGIYAIYYAGDFAPYSAIAEKNRHGEWTQPIYVGKAIPRGARRGGVGLDAPAGNVLSTRLREHAGSINEVQNLNVEDFASRHLIVDDIWIPLGESLLIEMFRPLWNMAVDGFGNHDQGTTRSTQQRSPWDMLHPGRAWADRSNPGRSIEDILESIYRHISAQS